MSCYDKIIIFTLFSNFDPEKIRVLIVIRVISNESNCSIFLLIYNHGGQDGCHNSNN